MQGLGGRKQGVQAGAEAGAKAKAKAEAEAEVGDRGQGTGEEA